MNDERLLVLKMLEKGKITAEEAAALLDALAGRTQAARPGEPVSGEADPNDGTPSPDAPGGDEQGEDTAVDDAARAPESHPEGIPLSAKAQEALDKTRERVEEALKKVRESVRKTSPPDIDHIVRTVRRGVSQVLDEIPDVMNRFLRLEIRSGPERVHEERYSGTLTPGAPVTVRVRNMDGPITVAVADGAAYEIRVINRVRTDDDAEAEALSRLATAWEATESGFVLTAGNHAKVSAHVRLALPPGPTYYVELESAGGSLALEGVTAEELTLHTEDGSVSVSGAAARTLRIHTEDGSVAVSRAAAGQLTVRTGDGSVTLRRIRAGELDVMSGEGSISFSGTAQRLRCKSGEGSVTATLLPTCEDAGLLPAAAGLAAAPEGDVYWHIGTDDGSVHVSVPSDVAYGYDVNLATSDGSVRVDLPDLEAAVGGGDGRFTGRTRGFETKPVRVRITANSGDGSLRVAAETKEAEA